MKNKLMKMTTMIILALAMILSTISVAAVAELGEAESTTGTAVENWKPSEESTVVSIDNTISITNLIQGDTVEIYKVITTKYNPSTNNVTREWANGSIKALAESINFSTVEEYAKKDENAKTLYEAVIKAASKADASIPQFQDSIIVGEDGTAQITVNEMGQYMIIGKGVNVYAPMTATFEPKYNKDSKKYEYYNQIEIGAKASKPTVEKQIVTDGTNSPNTDSVAINDVVEFELIVTAPVFPANAVDNTFVLRDTMEAGLQGVNSIAVKSNGETVEDYTVEYYADDKFENLTNNSAEARSFEISFKMKSEKVNGSKDIVVTYNSEVTEEMKPSTKKGDGEDNTVTLIWPKNVWKTASDYTVVPPEGQEDDYNREDDTVTVFTYGLVVTKTDENTKKPLEGAVFALYKEGVDEPLKPNLTTNDEGKIVVTGLDEGNYRLKEIKAPDGYVLLNEEIEFAIIGARYENGELTGYLKNEQGTILETAVVEVGVTNRQGFNLPKTGGAGTAIFTILGVVLMGGALLLVVRMRKANGAK